METTGQSSQPDKIALWLFFSIIISVTFLHKFSINLGSNQVFLGFAFMLGIAAFGFLSSRLEVNKVNFAAYTFMGGILALTQLLGQQEFSLISLMFLLAVHVPYIFQIKPGLLSINAPLKFFQNVMVFFGILGVLQFFGQFIIGTKYAFPIDSFLSQYVMKGYNSLNSLEYGSTTYKATAVFMLEPAMLCQYLAIAVIVEMLYFKNIRRLCAYFAGIAVTFSGTGLMLIFILAPIYLLMTRKFLILGSMIVILATAPLWAPAVGLGTTVGRATEFTSQNSSGYARFLSIFPTLNTFVFHETQTLLFGRGAGTILDIIHAAPHDYEAFNPSWGKMVFEYGIVGGLTYISFILFVIWRGTSSRYVKAALFLQLMLLGEFILAPMVHVLILAFIVWPRKEDIKLPEPKNIKAEEVTV